MINQTQLLKIVLKKLLNNMLINFLIFSNNSGENGGSFENVQLYQCDNC